MTINLDAESFALIMTLPRAERLDLLEFVGSTPVTADYLAQIISDLKLKDANDCPVIGTSN